MAAYRVYKRLCIALLALMFMAGRGRAQVPELINDPEFRPVAQAVVDSVYNLRFESAGKLLKPWKKKHPDHPLWSLIDGMMLWWEVLSDLDDTSHDERFVYLMKRTDYRAASLLNRHSSHADALIIKAISNGYIARHQANREEWISSINTARKAISPYQYLLELQPELPDLKLAEGLKLYYTAYLPEAYPIVKTVSWALPGGDREKGLEYLEEAADQALFARAEATYFLGNINYNYEKEYDKAVEYFESLYRQYPRNSYYVRKLVSSLYRLKRYDRAMEVIEHSIDRWERDQWPFEHVLREALFTWKGNIYRKNDKISEAISSYREAFKIGESLPQTSDRTYHLAAGYYLARLLHERGQQAEALHYLEKVMESEKESTYRDSAKRLMKQIRNN